MEYSKKGLAKKLIFAFVIIAAIMLILISQSNLDVIKTELSKAVPKYILLALLVLIIYFLINLISLFIIAKDRKIKVKNRDLFLIGGTEPFFNGITPFATGGQPFQAYALYRKGVKIEDATSMLVMNFITFLISTNIFAVISLLFYRQYIGHIHNLSWIVIMGFTINFGVLVLMFSLALSKGLRNLCVRAINWLSSKRMFKKLLEGKVEVFNNYFDGMQKGCYELLHKPLILISCILTKIISLIFFYSIPYFALKAVHAPINPNDMMYIILGTSFATTMVVWVPTPGGTGGMELAFFSIFMTLSGMTYALATSGMIIWRLYTYYLLMVIGFIFYMLLEWFEFRARKKKEKEELND